MNPPIHSVDITLEPADNERLAALCGQFDQNLHQLEERLGVEINSRGYRGPEWPPPGDEQVLVSGDSQAFGHGVEFEQTFGARLRALTGRAVLNAAVPTYGPGEALVVLRELLPERRPTLVILTLNAINDFQELEVPNRERYSARGGWATSPAASAPPGFNGAHESGGTGTDDDDVEVRHYTTTSS